jgi:hypothetical protein
MAAGFKFPKFLEVLGSWVSLQTEMETKRTNIWALTEIGVPPN